MANKILIVDDEKEIADLIEYYMQNESYETFKVYSAEDAMKIVNSENIDLAILDVMLPNMNGFELLKKIREKYDFPIIMLTAKIEDMDKIMGLTIGADDYMTKPFNPLELIARVKSNIRRYKKFLPKGDSSAFEFSFNGLFISEIKRKCTILGNELVLTPIEFDILLYLCKNQGKVISSEKIFEHVWGEKYLDNNNTVMTHIARLRQKMKEADNTKNYIRTVWGVGYTID